MKSEFNDLGRYIMISLCFVIGTMIEFAIVLFIDQVQQRRLNKSQVGPSKPQKESNGLVLIDCKSEARDATVRFRGRECFKGNDHKENKDQSYKKKVIASSTLALTRQIDCVSFILMTSLYLIYNFFYLFNEAIYEK